MSFDKSFEDIKNSVEVVGHLGAGFFGSVERVKYNGIDAVMKTAHDTYYSETYLNEAMMLFHIDGAMGCPRLLACCTNEKDTPCLVMSYVEGYLFESLEEEGKLSVQQVIEVYISVVQALRDLHEMGVIHMDLKAANMILNYSEDHGWTTRLIDFGFSQFEGCKANEQSTICYGKRVEASVDIYQLGKMMEKSMKILREDFGLLGEWPEMELLIQMCKQELCFNKAPDLDTIENWLIGFWRYLDYCNSSTEG